MLSAFSSYEMRTTFSCCPYHPLHEMLSTFSFSQMRATFFCCPYDILKKMLSAISFYEMRTTFLGCLYFQKVIRINIWKINVVRIFFWWNADNILSCPHVVRLSVVVRISSIPVISIWKLPTFGIEILIFSLFKPILLHYSKC